MLDRKEYHKKWYQENKEYHKAYYQRNKEEIRKGQEKYRQAHRKEIIEQGKEYHKQYRKKNKEKFKEYYQENKERFRERKERYSKKYRQENSGKLNERTRRYYQKNKEKLREKHKEYYKEHREEKVEYYLKNKERIKKYSTKYQRKRIKTNPQLRLCKNISSAINTALKGKKAGRHWEILVGYTLQRLIAHLEKQFDDKMSWSNQGSYWHLDHIKPQSLFKYETAEDPEFKLCWASENLQPLEAIENMRKGNKYEL